MREQAGDPRRSPTRPDQPFFPGRAGGAQPPRTFRTTPILGFPNHAPVPPHPPPRISSHPSSDSGCLRFPTLSRTGTSYYVSKFSIISIPDIRRLKAVEGCCGRKRRVKGGVKNEWLSPFCAPLKAGLIMGLNQRN